jgi:hypothetical protein
VLLEAGADRKAALDDGSIPGDSFEAGVGDETQKRIKELLREHDVQQGTGADDLRSAAPLSSTAKCCCCVCS